MAIAGLLLFIALAEGIAESLNIPALVGCPKLLLDLIGRGDWHIDSAKQARKPANHSNPSAV